MKSPFRRCLLLLSDYNGRCSLFAGGFCAVICNLCNTWKSDDAAIITHALNPILFVTRDDWIVIVLHGYDKNTGAQAEIAFHNGW